MLSPTYSRLPQSVHISSRSFNLLLFCDVPERIRSLRTAVAAENLRLTRTTSIEDLREACLTKIDIAIVDAGPDRIEEVLRLIRSTASLSKIPLLVSADRIASEQGLAGVLPVWRAMPCSREQMAMLIRHKLSGLSSGEAFESNAGKRLL